MPCFRYIFMRKEIKKDSNNFFLRFMTTLTEENADYTFNC